ncbi:histidine--tRNA ligase [Candidatus Bathyarchaeota archaeon]|nr:histidine--tRNA ligase [Candidatus Bathyarchaeota archaeon]
MTEFKTVRGMRDFLPQEAQTLRTVEARTRKVAELYGYGEIITPVVESYELLSAKAGDEVRSRMFAFKDLGDRDVALRPEFTASVARLVATSMRNEPRPFRLFSVGTIYRYDEPQKGRYREFWQSNFELMGSNRPEADAEILMLTNGLLEKIGLKNHAFKIGHVGVLRGIFSQENVDESIQSTVMQLMDKKQYDDALETVQKARVSERCLKVLRRLVELKGDKILDVTDKIEECIKDYEMAVAATRNLREILKLARQGGCNAAMTVEAGFERGLEYYTGMIFEVYVPDLNIALGGGGRYDRLIELFGGAPTPAVGVAHGLDRILLAMKEQKSGLKGEETKKVVIIPVGDELRGEALRISQKLRESNLSVEVEVMGRKMAKALEDADRRNFDYAVIIGEKELKEGAVVLRNLKSREQNTMKIDELEKRIK